MSSSEATTYISAIKYQQMQDAEDNFQGYVPVWLDTAMNDDQNTFSVCLGTLRTLQHVHKFNDGKLCFDFLCSITDKQAFLILSCKIDDQLLNDFMGLPQLEYIYQFGDETIMKKEQSKLVELASVQALYEHLSANSCYRTEEDNGTEFASLSSSATVRSMKDLNDDARVFIFYQLLIEILLRLPKTPQIRDQFYSFCMEKSSDNPVQQKIFLERMKNYTPDQTIPWYTSTCFFHRLLSRTCRLGIIKDMFKLAFFMVDLNAQMKMLHNEYFYSFGEKIHVYRGKRMPTSEYEKLKNSIGDLVVTKSFLSTTTKRDVACFYAGTGAHTSDSVPAVLHLIIDKHRNETKSFARLLYHSKIKADDEVLISIGTVFRIIERNEENGIQEFTLTRGDGEKDAERTIENALCDQAKENEEFFQSTSSIGTDEDYQQMANIFVPSDNQPREPVEETTPPTSSVQITAGMDGRWKRINMEMKNLEKIKDIFIVDRGPVYQPLPSSSDSNPVPSNGYTPIIIEGRILPKAEPYCRRSFRLTLTLISGYPFSSPNLRLLDSVYHPNVSHAGKICSELVNMYESYNPAITLARIIEGVEEMLSTTSFDENYFINNEAYRQYQLDRDKFNQIVLDYVLRFGSPRP